MYDRPANPEYYKICDALGNFCGFADVAQIVLDTIVHGIADILMTHIICTSYICMIISGYGLATYTIHYIVLSWVPEMNCEQQRPNSGSPPLSMLSYRRSWSLTVP